MKRFISLLLVTSLAAYQVCSQSCESAETCNECYAIPNCAWCADPNFVVTTTQGRCALPGVLAASTCSMIEDAQSSTELNERELNSDNQISLERAKVFLRAGQSQRLSVSIRPAENFPLDLYFLVDLSFSQIGDLALIKNISRNIVDTIRNISTRFQVGFGAYVDKLTLPYVSEVQLRKGCIDGNSECVLPFNYVHNINLTNNSAFFSDGFQNIRISTNVDDPEGTFDAIFQASLCDEVVGWRPNARKILLILTDDITHTAGDGKLAGIVRPPPFECLTSLDPDTDRITYTRDLDYDYPSIGQIRQVLIENTIVPVFAVSEENLQLYNTISGLLEGTNAATVTVSANSSNIISVIETAYENAVSRVALSFDAPPDVTITYSANCPEVATTNPDGLSCSDVVVNTTTTFNITIKLDQCSQAQNISRNITMIVPAYGQFEIEVIAVCSCDCHRSVVTNSTDCSYRGSRTCGVCDCDEGWSGDSCECNAADDRPCEQFGNLECSSRGSCDCGTCNCRQPARVTTNFPGGQYYNVTDVLVTGSPGYAIISEAPFVNGSACECDNFACPRNDSQFVCSGPTNGDCVCKGTGPECVCKTITFNNSTFTFSGDACQCSEFYCFDTSTGMKCNGRGNCRPCNRITPCDCNLGFEGRYCETSTSTTRAICSGNNDCIRCIADSSNYIEDCPCQSTAAVSYSRLASDNESHLINVMGAESGSTQRCTFTTTDPFCTYVYYIASPIRPPPPGFTPPTFFVAVEPDGECFPLRWWQLALILLAVLILIGIIILAVIKICFILADRAEWKKFEKEVAETDLSKNFNPLYHSPAVKYDNVAFGKE